MILNFNSLSLYELSLETELFLIHGPTRELLTSVAATVFF